MKEELNFKIAETDVKCDVLGIIYDDKYTPYLIYTDHTNNQEGKLNTFVSRMDTNDISTNTLSVVEDSKLMADIEEIYRFIFDFTDPEILQTRMEYLEVNLLSERLMKRLKTEKDLHKHSSEVIQKNTPCPLKKEQLKKVYELLSFDIFPSWFIEESDIQEKEMFCQRALLHYMPDDKKEIDVDVELVKKFLHIFIDIYIPQDPTGWGNLPHDIVEKFEKEKIKKLSGEECKKFLAFMDAMDEDDFFRQEVAKHVHFSADEIKGVSDNRYRPILFKLQRDIKSLASTREEKEKIKTMMKEAFFLIDVGLLQDYALYVFELNEKIKPYEDEAEKIRKNLNEEIDKRTRLLWCYKLYSCLESDSNKRAAVQEKLEALSSVYDQLSRKYGSRNVYDMWYSPRPSTPDALIVENLPEDLEKKVNLKVSTIIIPSNLKRPLSREICQGYLYAGMIIDGLSLDLETCLSHINEDQESLGGERFTKK